MQQFCNNFPKAIKRIHFTEHNPQSSPYKSSATNCSLFDKQCWNKQSCVFDILHNMPVKKCCSSIISPSYPPPSPAMLSLDPVGGAAGLMVVPKSEPSGGVIDFASRIGLNLGGRTYFSSEDDFVNRLYRRSRPVEPGSLNSPKCQAEGCNADLSHAKHYHRRHKVCEFHSKAATVITAGLTQRFCQQCSRFHLLSEFDNGKRSCRKRLADHNRRRRKSHHQPNQEPKSQLENNALAPSSENPIRSPPESGVHSASSVTVAVSPPRMSLDCFRQRSYQSAAASSPSTSSLFFSNG